MRRANITIVVLAVLTGICWIGLKPAAANNLQGISVERQGDSIAVTITTDGGCEYNAFLTDSKPERIVVDLTGVINDLPQKQFSNLPFNSFKSIRTSQFKSEPDAEARVVLDINRPIEFANYQAGNKVVVKFPAISGELASVNWASSGNEDAVDTSPASEEVAAVVEEVEEPVESVEKSVEVVEAPPTQIKEAAPEPVTQPDNSPKEAPAAEPEAPSQLAVSPPVSQGIQVDTSPKRRTVDYTAEDEKDPFKSLVGMATGKTAKGLPSLENLKLVGILEDNRISSALLEDSEGNGYILKPHDRIQSGYLVSVSDNKATFQITEYGWTRTVALELQVPEIK